MAVSTYPARRSVVSVSPFETVVQTAIISTDHLPQSDLDILWAAAEAKTGQALRVASRYPLVGADAGSDGCSYVLLHVSEDGYVVDADETDAVDARPLPCTDALWRLLESARQAGITYLQIDRDVEPSPNIPILSRPPERPTGDS